MGKGEGVLRRGLSQDLQRRIRAGSGARSLPRMDRHPGSWRKLRHGRCRSRGRLLPRGLRSYGPSARLSVGWRTGRTLRRQCLVRIQNIDPEFTYEGRLIRMGYPPGSQTFRAADGRWLVPAHFI